MGASASNEMLLPVLYSVKFPFNSILASIGCLDKLLINSTFLPSFSRSKAKTASSFEVLIF